jgi:hypothetical protein
LNAALRILRFWPGALLLLWIAAGLRSIALGKDVNWDLKNYHWYNAWAVLNGRVGYDVAPAQLQTYHNPLGDLPFYGLVHAIQNPRTVAFIMALPVAVAAYFLLRTLLLLFPFDRDRANGVVWIVAAALIGLTGGGGIAAWGATFNEWPSIALVMAALWLAVRAAIEGEGRRPFACVAGGFLVGCAMGLKLTFAVYALGFLASCMAYGTLAERLKRPLVAGIFIGLGFLATYGWWGWILWREFANPFFPYFNSIFQSPWWSPVDFFDRNFGPRNWRQAIFFPLYFAREPLLVAEISFRDWRFATLFVLALMSWAISRWRNLRENPNAPPPPPAPSDAAWRILALFALVSYLAWLKVFGIYRYLAALEVLSGALIVGCVLYIAPRGRVRMVIVVVLTGLLVGTTRMGGGWGRAEFGKTYFDLVAPELAPNALVIIGYSYPLAYAAPFFRADARFVSPANNFIMPGESHRLAKQADELIRGHRGPLYQLQIDPVLAQDPRTLAYFGLVRDEPGCRRVRSSYDNNQLRICPLRRSGS